MRIPSSHWLLILGTAFLAGGCVSVDSSKQRLREQARAEFLDCPAGPEDFAIQIQGDRSRLIVASDDRTGRFGKRALVGYFNLADPQPTFSPLQDPEGVFQQYRPHGICLGPAPAGSSEPSLYVVAHPKKGKKGSQIIRFRLTRDSLEDPEFLVSGAAKELIHWPNEIVAADDGTLYVSTNPKSLFAQFFRTGDVLRYRPNNEPSERWDYFLRNRFRLANGLQLAAGHLLVSSSHGKRLRAFQLADAREVAGGFRLPHGLDNLMPEQGVESGLTSFTGYESTLKFIISALSPSRFSPTQLYQAKLAVPDAPEVNRLLGRDGKPLRVHAASAVVAVNDDLYVANIFLPWIARIPAGFWQAEPDPLRPPPTQPPQE